MGGAASLPRNLTNRNLINHNNRLQAQQFVCTHYLAARCLIKSHSSFFSLFLHLFLIPAINRKFCSKILKSKLEVFNVPFVLSMLFLVICTSERKKKIEIAIGKQRAAVVHTSRTLLNIGSVEFLLKNKRVANGPNSS